MKRSATFAETRQAVRELGGGPLGFVPTLGYWHEGHVALADRARDECGVVVASIFVNPLQFDQPSDLDAYPRDVERDAALAATAGVDVLFVPSPAAMYPTDPQTRVSVGRLAERLEGAHRPGHFEGVATVVAKLFAGIQPDRAYLGRKDAQQLAVVTRMTHDLSFPVTICPISTVREFDGLALSSRNARLTPGGRAAAVALSTGLMRAADAVEAGERSSAALAAIAARAMAGAPGVEPEYAEVANADDIEPVDEIHRSSFLAVAAQVGEVRLIDNLYLDVDGDRITPDRGTWLNRSSTVYG